MLSSRPTARILALRPLRPPSQTPTSRLFTQNSQLLLIAAHTPRPQLPYLYQPRSIRPAVRLLSTETKAHIKEQLWLASKYTAYGWTMFFLGCIAWIGFQMEVDERKNPTPSEWHWRVRSTMREGRNQMSQERVNRYGFVNWALAAVTLREILYRLESEDYEGKGLKLANMPTDQPEPLDGVDIQLGYKSFDLEASGRSWEWKSGYYEVCMSLAKAAEHLEHHVRDVKQKLAFPRTMVIGPSNPDPRPTPNYMGEAPLEENCVKCFEGPDIFYRRIIEGNGFTTKQKMDAASAYANWLSIKGRSEEAQRTYELELQFAKDGLVGMTGLPDDVLQESVIDSKTAVIKDHGQVTPNILRAATDLAIHSARTGNVSAALPIFLSVLRARRSAPVSPYAAPEEKKPSRSLLSMLSPTPFPPPPPSGNEPFVRYSDKPTCEDSELMLYIGEILFATSPQTDEALGWTRQAVTIADASMPTVSDSEEQVRCKECLVTGAKNWDAMLLRAASKLESTVPKRSWLGFGGNKQELEEKAWDLAEQQKSVEILKERILREGIEQAVARAGNSNPSGRWIQS